MHPIQRSALDVVVNNAGYGHFGPDYVPARAANVVEFEIGDPKATRGPILELADTDDPPARVFFGKPFEAVAAEHAERLETWRKWQPFALAAFG